MPEITTLIYAPYYKPIDTRAFRTRIVSISEILSVALPSFIGVSVEPVVIISTISETNKALTNDKGISGVSAPTTNVVVIESSTAGIRGV